ncbi:benzoylformate decarboxylase [Nocardia sp. NPDC059091]|uniref:benzoylformate decarboxylase n=1 Tax=unclassified Nocardia TaxID=2637762 RepID=UPI0036A71E21
MTTVREATIDLCRTLGLTTWFGNPGSSELTLLQDFPDDFRYFLGLQEMVPVAMADAWAQITGKPAIVNLHTAPGMGNAQGALYNAHVNKTPLIVTAGNQRRIMQNQYCLLTNLDPTVVPKPFVKYSAEPAIASELPAVLAHAYHIATTPPMGPVFVSMPMDDCETELDDGQLADIHRVRDRKVSHSGGFSEKLAQQVATRLDAARSPVIIVGGDVERYGAREDVVALAARTQATVWTAPLTGMSGFPENHPLYQGLLPAAKGPLSDKLTGHDFVLVIGSPVFRYYPLVEGSYLPDGTTLVQLTNDPDEAARAPIGDSVVGDLTALTRAILDRVTRSDRPSQAPRGDIPALEPASAPLAPESLWNAVGRAAPSDTLWVSECGSNEQIVTDLIRPSGPKSHLTAAGEGLGFGLPAAVGAQLAAPDRPVVALMGDGSIQYAITALWTAAHYRIPLTIVVAANSEYGILKEFGALEKTFGVPGLDVPDLDVAATAASFGVQSHRAGSADEVSDLVGKAVADHSNPTLIEVPITKVPIH